jgi:hypothetical protein
MGSRTLAVTCALLTGCSFVFVKEPTEPMKHDPNVPVSCTTSRTMPLLDLAIGAIGGGLIWLATYKAVESFNNDSPCNGDCYHPYKPATLAAFLVVSPWWISSAVGFSDTGRCRDTYRARNMPIYD